MRTLHRALSAALLVGATALAGIAAAGCETDDSSTPLPPPSKDATTDHTSDGAGGGSEAAPQPESSTPESSAGEAGVTDGSDGAAD
jgi:hypothetical protein